MTSKNIYDILESKPHNPHYLKRYWKFICSIPSDQKGYTESHHICPKSKDLFPEYSSFRENPWNKVKLTPRQHFIAHWMLWKAYSGNQTYAFLAMCNGQKSKFQTERYNRVNSKTYALVKEFFYSESSKSNHGKACFVDQDGNRFYISVTDSRVVSGELVAQSKGRKLTRKSKCSESTKRKMREARALSTKSKNPDRKQTIYFLHFRHQCLYYSDKYIEMLEQGWSTKQTPEHREWFYQNNSKISASKLTKEDLIERGKNISAAKRRKKL